MISEQEKGVGKAGALSKIPFVRTIAGAGAIAGKAAALPFLGLVKKGADKEKNSIFKKLMAGGGKLLKTGTKIVKTAYAYAVAPKHLRNVIKKLWRAWPSLRIRLINLWVLIYPDIHDPKKSSVVYYAPNGAKLVQTSISNEDAAEFTKKVSSKSKGQEEISKIEQEEKEIIKQELNSDGIEYNELDMIEEEILNEVLGLPPVAALLGRWKYGKDATLVRYRIWVLQFFDTARNKTYVSVYDAIPQELEEGEELKPIQTFSYEGKQEVIT